MKTSKEYAELADQAMTLELWGYAMRPRDLQSAEVYARLALVALEIERRES